MSQVRRVFAVLCASVMLAVVAASPASAANQNQSGLVNVAVGDVTIQDVNVGVAANLAVAACVGDVNVAAVIADIRDPGGFSCDIQGSDQRLTLTQQ